MTARYGMGGLRATRKRLHKGSSLKENLKALASMPIPIILRSRENAYMIEIINPVEYTSYVEPRHRIVSGGG